MLVWCAAGGVAGCIGVNGADAGDGGAWQTGCCCGACTGCCCCWMHAAWGCPACGCCICCTCACTCCVCSVTFASCKCKSRLVCAIVSIALSCAACDIANWFAALAISASTFSTSAMFAPWCPASAAVLAICVCSLASLATCALNVLQSLAGRVSSFHFWQAWLCSPPTRMISVSAAISCWLAVMGALTLTPNLMTSSICLKTEAIGACGSTGFITLGKMPILASDEMLLHWLIKHAMMSWIDFVPKQ